MSDYWVSQTRHWCKYCKKYIQNNKPSIQIHESGRSHKENVERFLRDVYKKGKQNEEEADNVRQELERIEKAALSSLSEEERRKYLSSKSSALSTPSSARSGYYDIPPQHIPTIEELRLQAEEEKKLKEQPRVEGRDEWAVNKEIAKVGEWEIVQSASATSSVDHDKNKSSKKATTSTATDNVPEIPDDEEDQEDLHNFKIREKDYPADLDLPAESNSNADQNTEVLFKKRKLGDSESAGVMSKFKKKKPLRKKD